MEISTVLMIALAGILGTTVMVLVMGLIHGLKWADADMVRAIGSIYTRSLEDAFPVGLVIHYTAGVFFAFLYSLVISAAPIPPTSSHWTIFMVTLLVGIFHRLVVSMMLAVVVAEYHPMERFRNAGLGVILSHLLGHVFYGATVGLVFVLSGTKFNFFSAL